jgi:hypothetical protein
MLIRRERAKQQYERNVAAVDLKVFRRLRRRKARVDNSDIATTDAFEGAAIAGADIGWDDGKSTGKTAGTTKRAANRF